jgi:putative hydrolase of the HAD superfamily
MFDIIAFDADDTLWHNEILYSTALDGLKLLLAPYAPAGQVESALFETEMRNLACYGYGIKSYALSMIETAIAISQGAIDGHGVMQVIGLARDMLNAEVRLFDHVKEVVTRLSASYPLMVITKGDLLDQERKLERSGLASYFPDVEVVNHKTEAVYRAILDRRGIDPARFLMIGNALRSDIVPVLTLGGHAVHIPYETSWAHESVPDDVLHALNYITLPHMGDLPGLVAALEQRSSSQPG